jgi:formylglycine-generating enzyme required for sulfatase activity
MEDAGKVPADKEMKIDGLFPWGAAWPPPQDAGNFGGEEIKRLIDARQWPEFTTVLTGYRDAYLYTASTASFPANEFGLYDLAGNAIEFCQDWYDAQQKTPVLRGGSWKSRARETLLSSKRYQGPTEGGRSSDLGFRVVLAPVAP